MTIRIEHDAYRIFEDRAHVIRYVNSGHSNTISDACKEWLKANPPKTVLELVTTGDVRVSVSWDGGRYLAVASDTKSYVCVASRANKYPEAALSSLMDLEVTDPSSD